MRLVLIVLLIVGTTACQSLTADDQDIALQAELEAYGTEAAFLRNQIQSDRTAVVSTVAIISTQAEDFTRYNSVLVATVRAGIPPTATPPPFNAEAQGPMPLAMFDLSSGEMRFVQVGTAGRITENDRCFVAHQTLFDATTTPVIYMTTLALNLRAGTIVRVDWQFGGQVVYSNSWTAPQSRDGQCIALELLPSNAPFTPGNWTATLVVNDEALDAGPFSITGG